MNKSLLLIAVLFSQIAFSQSKSINENWLFSIDNSDWRAINLPHTWNDEDAHDDERGMYMGEAMYKKTIYLPASDNNNIYLKFEGANQVSKVFVNGKQAGAHKGGYTAFVVDITSFIKLDSDNEILIKVDNAINPDIPPLSADFTFYGGIYRDVWLIRKPGIRLDLTDGSTKGVYISQNTNAQSASIAVKTNIQSDDNSSAYVSINVFDAAMKSIASTAKKNKLTAGKNEVTAYLSIDNPDLWSPESPNLYTVEVEILDKNRSSVYDAYVGKIGFRWFDMEEDRSFTLNGNPLKLIGANRHQDFEGLGNALPDHIHRRDIQLLKEMGGNFIRIAHYPQDPAFLQACDELGVLVWEEIPIVNEITQSDAFLENSMTMLQEMIRQNYNHTSVIMWGYMNEVMLKFKRQFKKFPDFKEEPYKEQINLVAKTLDSVVRAEDPSRFSTIAHHGNYDLYQEVGLNDINDIVGWNIYYGWYGNDPKWERAGKFFDEFNSKHPSKGIIVAEYGAGADPRIHAIEPKRFDFSVEWQTRYHANYLRQINERPHVMGATIWNFVDFGSEGRSDAVPRINSKGMLTVDRQPKDSYLFYQAALLNKPYLKIGNTHWKKRKGFSSSETLSNPIVVFTNQEEVEVILNGTSVGKYSTKDFQIHLDLDFEDGENQVIVKANDLMDYARYEVTIVPTNLKSLTPKEVNISMNVGAHVYFHHPETDVLWLPEQAYKEGGMGYIDGHQLGSNGWKIGVGSEIYGSNLEPVYQTHRDTISSFKADVPDGLYEVTLHFAEIYAKEKREKLAYNLGSDREEVASKAERSFEVTLNKLEPIEINRLSDFMANAIKTTVFVKDGEGITIGFEAKKGSAFLSGIEIKGF